MIFSIGRYYSSSILKMQSSFCKFSSTQFLILRSKKASVYTTHYGYLFYPTFAARSFVWYYSMLPFSEWLQRSIVHSPKYLCVAHIISHAIIAIFLAFYFFRCYFLSVLISQISGSNEKLSKVKDTEKIIWNAFFSVSTWISRIWFSIENVSPNSNRILVGTILIEEMASDLW